MQRKCDKYSGKPVYWLCAHRYAGDMNLMLALEGNLGDPGGQSRMRTYKSGSICSKQERYKSDGNGVLRRAFRKSDEVIVAENTGNIA
jgi:hypothetical protein